MVASRRRITGRQRSECILACPHAYGRSTDDLTIRPLAPDTWRAFADLVERHNGVFGGCWCTWFHTLSRDKDRTYESNRDLKCQLVEDGRAHAALVFDGDEAVAWAQYGPPDELPNLHHRQEYEAGLVRRRTTGSPASSWTGATGGAGSRRWRCEERWT